MKSFSLVVAFAILMIFTGCGGDGGEDNSISTNTPVQENVTDEVNALPAADAGSYTTTTINQELGAPPALPGA